MKTIIIRHQIIWLLVIQILFVFSFSACSDNEDNGVKVYEYTEQIGKKIKVVTDIQNEAKYGLRKGMYPESSRAILEEAEIKLKNFLQDIKENKVNTQELPDATAKMLEEADNLILQFKNTIRTEDLVVPADLYVYGSKGGYIDFGVHPEFSRFGEDGQQVFTIEFWIDLKSTDQTNYILSTFIEDYGAGIRKGWGINRFRDNNRFRITYGIKEVDLFEPGFSFGDNYDKWVHIAIVTDERSGVLSTKIYMDGEEVSSEQSSKPERYYISNDHNVSMTAFVAMTPAGALKTWESADGSIKHLHIWSSAKTQEEIVKLKNGETAVTGKEADLVCGWTFDKLAMDENDIKDLDMQGDLYEYMLGKLNSAGRLGAFRTPKHIRDMMVKLMMPTPDMKICDPACGTAGFLISSAEYIRSEYGNKMTAEQWEKYGSETFTGFDTDETMCRLSCMNLMLHSVINPQLNKQDSVSKDYQVKDAYDLILANPPFKGTINKENINESLLAITNTTKTELLFVALFIRLLRVGGRCACIVPDGVLFGSSKAHKNLRKELIENQYLEAVISMPSGVFKPYAGVSTAILIFTKTNGTGTDKVWFYDMKADGYSLDDKRQPVQENDIPDIIERFHKKENEEDRERTEQSFMVDKQEIIDNGYDLSINKYKKIEYVPVEYPPTEEILAEIEELNEEITKETAELRALLRK